MLNLSVWICWRGYVRANTLGSERGNIWTNGLGMLDWMGWTGFIRLIFYGLVDICPLISFDTIYYKYISSIVLILLNQYQQYNLKIFKQNKKWIHLPLIISISKEMVIKIIIKKQPNKLKKKYNYKSSSVEKL